MVRASAALAIACFVAVALVACAATRRQQPAGSRAQLLADEIDASGARTVHDAISRLRPEWLRRRGRISIQDPNAGEIVVYLDGLRYGGVGSLTTLRAGAVEDITYMDASDATTRFGTGHGGGAILIRTR